MDNTYLAHFGLVEEPYSTSPNPRYLYISPTHNLALEKTKWTITTKRGLSLVFGPVGTGKTTLARELAQRLEENPSVSYVFITNPNFPTPNQLLRAINQEFEVPQSAKSYLDLLNIFKNFLMTQALTKQKTLVLIIDEAQTLKAPLRGNDCCTEKRASLKNLETEESCITPNTYITYTLHSTITIKSTAMTNNNNHHSNAL